MTISIVLFGTILSFKRGSLIGFTSLLQAHEYDGAVVPYRS